MTEKQSVVFLSPGGLGSGEIVNAVIVADQLRKKGVECSFFTFPYGARFIEPYNFEYIILQNDKLTNINLMKKHISQKNPDIIVIADYYLFRVSKALSRFLWIGWMKEIDIPVISFDSLYLGREFPKPVYFSNPELFPKQKYNITFKVPDFVQTLIYPSPPYNEPPPGTDVCGRLYEETFCDYEPNLSIREELGIHPDEKLIFHIIPKWAVATMKRSTMLDFPEYYPMLAELLQHHFKKLGEPLHIVCVSPSKTTLYTQTDTLKVNQVDFLPFDLYMKYLISADLVITDNILSATVWKAVLYRVPALVLGNSLMSEDPASKFDTITENFDVSKEFSAVVRKYVEQSSSPYLPILSFWTFYTELFSKMDIAKTFFIQEVFDEQGTYEILSKILTDQPFKDDLRKRQDEYVRKISEMPTMADIVLSIAKSSG